jgi:hypothetical protein
MVDMLRGPFHAIRRGSSYSASRPSPLLIPEWGEVAAQGRAGDVEGLGAADGSARLACRRFGGARGVRCVVGCRVEQGGGLVVAEPPQRPSALVARARPPRPIRSARAWSPRM